MTTLLSDRGRFRGILRQLTRVIGIALLVGAGAAYVTLWFDRSEKPGAVYVAGHWWDVGWEIVAPAAVTGAILLVAGSFRLSRILPPKSGLD